MLSILVRFWFAVWRWLKFKVNPPQYDFLKAGEERIRLADWKHSVAMAAFDFEMALQPQRMKLLCGPGETVLVTVHFPMRSLHLMQSSADQTWASGFGMGSDACNAMLAGAQNATTQWGDRLQNAQNAYSHAYQRASNIPPQATYGTPTDYVPIEFPKVLFGSGGQRIAGSMGEQIALIGIGYKEHP